VEFLFGFIADLNKDSSFGSDLRTQSTGATGPALPFSMCKQ